ncbi:MAG TPA: hypothetical protein VGG06_29910 [Thermoanaerobaculia bacterium]
MQPRRGFPGLRFGDHRQAAAAAGEEDLRGVEPQGLAPDEILVELLKTSLAPRMAVAFAVSKTKPWMLLASQARRRAAPGRAPRPSAT